MVREIMTIQLGGYSNFAGAHFWNLQARFPWRDPQGAQAANIHPDAPCYRCTLGR
jgi:hypothetical protein